MNENIDSKKLMIIANDFYGFSDKLTFSFQSIVRRFNRIGDLVSSGDSGLSESINAMANTIDNLSKKIETFLNSYAQTIDYYSKSSIHNEEETLHDINNMIMTLSEVLDSVKAGR